MSRSTKVTWSLAIALPAATVAALWALQARSDSSTAPLTYTQPRKSFAVFRTPPERPSPAMRATIETAAQRRGLDLSLGRSQRVVTRGGSVAWLVPGNGTLCLFRDRTGAHECDATRNIARDGMTMVVFEPPERPEATPKRYLLLGVATDRVGAVRIRGRAETTVPVVDNVYSLRTDSPPGALDAGARVAGDSAPHP